MTRRRLPRAVPWALAAGMAVIGFAPILVRWAAEAPPLTIVAWRTLFATALLAPVALGREGTALRRLGRRELGWMGVAGALLGLHFAAWTASLYHTSVASASVLVTSSPLFLVVLGWAVLRERPTTATLAAVLAGVAGAVLIATGDARGGVFPRAALGNALALSAALLVAVYLLIGRAVRPRVPLLAYLLPVYAASALTTWAAAALAGDPLWPSATVLGLCLLLALGPQLIGHGAFNYAVRFVPAAVVGLATLAEPVVGTLLALVFFAEVPSALALVGMGLVLGAIGWSFAREVRVSRPPGSAAAPTGRGAARRSRR